MKGVSAVPAASISAPRMMTRIEPYLSATAPKIGCATPHMNWPTASAKLIDAMPRPVAVLIGDRNRPMVWRAPMVIIMMAAAASISAQAARELCAEAVFCVSCAHCCPPAGCR